MPQIRSAPGWRVLATMLVLFANGAEAAEVCAPEPQGDGRIASVIDARTILLEDGRQIRLAGLAAIPENAAAREALHRSIGATVSLHSDSESPDRYGRQRAVVFIEGSEKSLQVSLLAVGAALYDGVLDATGCRAEFTEAEAAARSAQKGLWAASRLFVARAEKTGDILERIGQFTVVEGQVHSVRRLGGTSYVNFGRRWTQGFSVSIPNRALAAFEAAGLSPASLEGRKVRVRGIVEARIGPRIEASRPTQIEMAGPEALATAVGTRN